MVGAIVEDICAVVRDYYRHDGDLEPGQLIYNAAAIGERGGREKTIAKTRLVPVRLTLVADEDVAATVPVNLLEARASDNHCVGAASSSGLLIQATDGSAGGSGALRTKRSGWAA